MKVVINSCHSGFSLSRDAVQFMADHGNEVASRALNENREAYSCFDDDRANPDLVVAVESLGDKANEWGSKLKIVDVPDDVKWHIAEYDGLEWVAEDHRTWD